MSRNSKCSQLLVFREYYYNIILQGHSFYIFSTSTYKLVGGCEIKVYFSSPNCDVIDKISIKT